MHLAYWTATRLETRRFSLNVEEVDLVTACERAAGAQREEARGRQIELQVHTIARAVVVGDGDRVLQIVSNLVSNALHATPAGGEVAVDVGLGEGVGRVTVSDTGPGIPEAARATILRPFVTSDVRHGVGLGLPVASELAIAMGGTLVVGERPGGGAAFTLSLPLTAGRGRAPGPPRSAPESTEPASELVAE